ncbi:DUF2950 domain-containing protein [Mesorhizobium sp. L-8-3]|uniref:DUF2950 domain-containing protein n=1 Tax=Mesorhizobium sp. L-8-3 TaxID=2744522 RepID=UPI0019286180|nr:DUF2950 domain-containing protein [Mesorhizobium sp. L-8-3]BCH25037.1 hypothetical protein MesoLjLb_48220 [Mesorhizobium sp. L-8-3]
MTMNATRMLLRSLTATALVSLPLAFGSVVSFAQQDDGISSFAAAMEPPLFDTPSAAIEAFKASLAVDDFDGLAKLLGLDAAKLKAEESTKETFEQIRQGAARQVVVQDLGDRQLLQIGDRLWPLPFPIVKDDDGKWYFDTYAGLEEIINRRVGENELEAISTLRALVEAQEEYSADDHDGDSVLEYAQKLISSEGATDGLYWPPDQGDGESLIGEFADQAALGKARQGEGYFGYRFRVLTGQGDNVAGGRYDYVINGNMIAGFGLVAWPVKYGETGVHTFVVNRNGVVYEADLGEETETIATGIKRFNPDQNWDVVAD